MLYNKTKWGGKAYHLLVVPPGNGSFWKRLSVGPRRHSKEGVRERGKRVEGKWAPRRKITRASGDHYVKERTTRGVTGYALHYLLFRYTSIPANSNYDRPPRAAALPFSSDPIPAITIRRSARRLYTAPENRENMIKRCEHYRWRKTLWVRLEVVRPTKGEFVLYLII